MAQQRKPFDLGNGLVCASFGIGGEWLSVSAVHPRVGIVELSGAPAFPPERDGDVDLVRAHRSHLTDPATAMLRIAGARATPPDRDLEWHLHGDEWQARAHARIDDTAPTLTQEYRLSAAGPGALQLGFHGRLDRPGYAEITPGGPIPPALPAQTVEPDGATLTVRAPLGDDDPVVRIDVASPGLRVEDWVTVGDEARLQVTWARPLAGVPLLVTVTLACGGPTPSPRSQGWQDTDAGRAPAARPPGLAGIATAAARYTLGCTALELEDGQCCILTDHRLLPLSWTRDAYYQAALLLALATELPEATAVVRRHLTWLWHSGSDDAGVWRRSHLSTGAVKDSGYQVDQQLFPLLELVDFRRTTDRWPGPSAATWGAAVRRVWQHLPRDDNGLLPGEENPADDPAEYPYLLSSQLLLVYVARRLAEFESELGTADLRFHEDAAGTLAAVRTTFTCPGPFGDQWAYEADGHGGHRLYHDANDLPTALAPLWDLCPATDPTWRATMRFAFSTHNPGYVTGARPGLGSAHTPGVWPLGDVQEWVVAVTEGDRDRADAAASRITEVASADGMLPETYDPQTGHWLARPWFAWPGSAVGLLHATLIQDRGPWSTRHRRRLTTTATGRRGRTAPPCRGSA